MERMLGVDAVFLHLETADTPLHTLKILLLDPTRRGRPIELSEVRAAVSTRLGLVARSTQKPVFLPGFARPFWVEDPDFDVSAHLDRLVLPAPGGRDELDALAAKLAATHLERSRPLWALTLVDGLADGRQALVVRVHHSIMDGLAARNTFLACTTSQPGTAVPPQPAAGGPSPPALLLWLRAFGAIPRSALQVLRLIADAWQAHTRARAFRTENPDTAPFVGAERKFFNTRCASARVCASAALPFEQFRSIAKASDTTINGVLHTVVALAVRREFLHRGEKPPLTTAVFGVGADPNDNERRWGNRITPTTVRLYSDQEDPLDALRLTNRSCRLGVELRRVTGLEMGLRWTEFTCRISPFFQRLVAYVLPRTVNHVTTANVAGPSETRWFGDVEVADWISFAVTVPPSNFNLTVYSYAGSMSMGLITAPEVMDEPRRFLGHMSEALSELAAAVATPTSAVSQTGS
jgi:diacylglycerol O-acyltransferase